MFIEDLRKSGKKSTRAEAALIAKENTARRKGLEQVSSS